MLSLLARLGFDGSGFDAGMANAKRNAARWGDSVASTIRKQLASAFGYYAIVRATQRTFEWASRLSDLSHATGLSTDALQRFEYAAKQNGASLEEVQQVVFRLARSQQEALLGNKKYQESFERFGITLEDLKKLKAEDIFLRIARSFKERGFEAAYADLVALGERASRNLVAALVSGFEDAAKEIDPVNAQVIAQLDAIADKVVMLSQKFTGYLAPALSVVIDRARDVSDLMEIIVGGTARFWGNFSRTGSLGEAAKAQREFTNQVLDKRAADQRALAAEGGRLMKGSAGLPIGARAVGAAAAKAIKISDFQSDSLARIGGSASPIVDRSIAILQQQITFLRNIDRNTEKTANKSETTEFA